MHSPHQVDPPIWRDDAGRVDGAALRTRAAGTARPHRHPRRQRNPPADDRCPYTPQGRAARACTAVVNLVYAVGSITYFAVGGGVPCPSPSCLPFTRAPLVAQSPLPSAERFGGGAPSPVLPFPPRRSCPVSTGGGTRRVQLVREGTGWGGGAFPSTLRSVPRRLPPPPPPAHRTRAGKFGAEFLLSRSDPQARFLASAALVAASSAYTVLLRPENRRPVGAGNTASRGSRPGGSVTATAHRSARGDSPSLS